MTIETQAPPGAERPVDAPMEFIGLRTNGLRELSRANGWSLDAEEMAAIQAHFRGARREPTRAELETLAQTWSEHCKHKTLTGSVRYIEGGRTRRFKNLLLETVMDATIRLKKPWCLSVFRDNAGIVDFDGKWALAYKVETHNHPCAIEPYGGAATGTGGVIRDILGAGLGAKPILNTDVFCVCPPDLAQSLPAGVLHPRRTLTHMVAGVRDYGNRMGIPTAAGALWFDAAYRFNPLIFCGTVGLLPAWAVRKEVRAGDLILAVGGRTGRDGIHGATFSSASLDDSASRSAVQIGHAICEKRLLDALITARDRRLYRAVTDCGAGGFSSAIGELGADRGARVHLERAHLKDSALAPWEIWLSESQERMVLAVPPKNLNSLKAVLAAEGVEYATLGEFSGTGRIEVFHGGRGIVDLPMDFLHHGLPARERTAVWDPPKAAPVRGAVGSSPHSVREALYALLGHLNVCSRSWVIRQYDHEVQGGTVIKPLQGAEHDGPGDACVLWPRAVTGDPENFRGIAVAHGINPSYGKLDPYAMALACVDEALRNLACVGADISRACLLDNFCWGNPEDPALLGGLVRAALGCRDAALGFQVPFISGKDSLYNEFLDPASKTRHAIPGTLLISALAPVIDIRKCVTMDFKASGNPLYLIGRTEDEFGGSLYAEWSGRPFSRAPRVDLRRSRQSLLALGRAIVAGAVSSAHDLSEGGLAVALAEMAFAGGVGACVDLDLVSRNRDILQEGILLFSESPSRFLVEILPEKERAFLKIMRGLPLARIGATTANPVLRLSAMDGSTLLEEPLEELKATWLNRLPEALEGGKAR